MHRLSRFAALVLLASGLAPLISHGSAPLTAGGRMAAVPRIVLWAWERPEDLRFLDSHIGVAYLAGTATLTDHGMSFRPRLQPLQVSPDAKLIAVIRIETTPGAVIDDKCAAQVAAAIARASSKPRVLAVQVDFDATASERPFYRVLLTELRRKLPAQLPISITALASWCIGDDWLSGLPIDEAVPMLFRLGVGKSEVSSWMGSGRDFREPACRTSLGVSLDEPQKDLPAGRRVYAFSPAHWTEHSLQALFREMHSWR